MARPTSGPFRVNSHLSPPDGHTGDHPSRSPARRGQSPLGLAAALPLAILVILSVAGCSETSTERGAAASSAAPSVGTAPASLPDPMAPPTSEAAPTTQEPSAAASTSDGPAINVDPQEPTGVQSGEAAAAETALAEVPDSDGVLPDPVDDQPYQEKIAMPTVESAVTSPPAAVPFDAATATSAAQDSLRAFLLLADQSYQTASVVPGLEDVGGGFALGEVQSGALERWTSGLRQIGSTAVVSMDTESTDLQGPPPEVVLKVCLDASGLDVQDAAGNSLKASLYNPGHPTLNVYGVQHDGQAWKVTNHQIPDDQSACGG